MGDIVISVENLSKEYTLGARQRAYTSLRETIMDNLAKSFRRLTQPGGKKVQAEQIWALKDVSFEVERGEVVGIIGRNGAGKSTLLKVLSRITKPTSGRAVVRGRVGSLLEVGTGFHPELTGRENIFLNGAILGMHRKEIERKFDEIVAFSEIERFLDTPVKRYSSGMYVRLAFAVAAHLDTEILFVDEVLAVGDAAFQKKCLGKIGEVGKEGRTILIVSHQMDMVRALCNNCYLLKDGKILFFGYPEKVIESYLAHIGRNEVGKNYFSHEINPNLELQVIRGRILDKNHDLKNRFDVFESIVLEIEYVINKSTEGMVVNFELKRNGMVLFISFDTDNDEKRLEKRKEGIYKSLIHLPTPLLKPGHYSLSTNIGIANRTTIEHLDEVLEFDVELLSKPSSLLSYAEKRQGMIAMPLDWYTEIVIEKSLNDGKRRT